MDIKQVNVNNGTIENYHFGTGGINTGGIVVNNSSNVNIGALPNISGPINNISGVSVGATPSSDTVIAFGNEDINNNSVLYDQGNASNSPNQAVQNMSDILGYIEEFGLDEKVRGIIQSLIDNGLLTEEASAMVNEAAQSHENKNGGLGNILQNMAQVLSKFPELMEMQRIINTPSSNGSLIDVSSMSNNENARMLSVIGDQGSKSQTYGDRIFEEEILPTLVVIFANSGEVNFGEIQDNRNGTASLSADTSTNVYLNINSLPMNTVLQVDITMREVQNKKQQTTQKTNDELGMETQRVPQQMVPQSKALTKAIGQHPGTKVTGAAAFTNPMKLVALLTIVYMITMILILIYR